MFAQQPQNNQYQPYLLPTQQPDAFDQATKLIDLVERLASKNRATEGGNIAPGTSQYSPLNAGMFQAQNPESIAIQELLLKNPELLHQYQALQQQKQQGVAPQLQQQQLPEGSRVLSAEQAKTIQQNTEVLVKASQDLYKQLQQSWVFINHTMNVLNELGKYTADLEKLALLGYHSQNMATAFLNELEAVKDLALVQQAMLTTPQYLLLHGFDVIKNQIEGNEDDAMDLISQVYLDCLKTFEDKKKSITGSYSPQYQEYLQSQINQQQQVRQPSRQQQHQPQSDDANIQLIRQFAQGLQQEGFASQIKRAHTQRMVASGGR